MASVQVKVTAEAAPSRSRILWGTTGQGVRNGSPVGTCLSACLSPSLMERNREILRKMWDWNEAEPPDTDLVLSELCLHRP